MSAIPETLPGGTVILENACGTAVVDLRGARVVSWRPHGTGEAFGAGGLACADPIVMRCRFHVADRRDVNRFWTELSLVGEAGALRLSVLVRLAGGISVSVSAKNSTDAIATFRASFAVSFAVCDPARCLFNDLAATFRIEGLPLPDVAPDYRLASPSARFSCATRWRVVSSSCREQVPIASVPPLPRLSSMPPLTVRRDRAHLPQAPLAQ